MNTPDHLAHVAALRQLAGREEPVHVRTAATVRAVDVLSTATRTWTAFPPRPAALDAAIVQADAVARSLRELRTAALAERNRGGATDA